MLLDQKAMACKSEASLTLRRRKAELVGTLDLDQGSQHKNILPSTTWVGYHNFILSPLLTNLSFIGRAPFDALYHVQPAPPTGSNRLSFAPRNIYHQPSQEHITLSNADNHFRFAQNLRGGVPINPAPPRPNNAQLLAPREQKRNNLFSQQNNAQSLDSIDQLANAMLLQKSMPHSQTESQRANVFQGSHPPRINQLQPQRQQVTSPFNLS